MPFDDDGIAQHGIGRGDFAALVFSGSVEALDEVIGKPTWATARKFVLPDPRLGPDRDLAHQSWCPFPRWDAPILRPTPGVCFVFDNAAHPAIAELRMRDGVEWEQFVSLDRLTLDELYGHMIERTLGVSFDAGNPGAGPIILLGYGMGELVARALERARVAKRRIMVVESRERHAVCARMHGYSVIELDEARQRVIAEAEAGKSNGLRVISSLPNADATFIEFVDAGRQRGVPALDLSLPWDQRPEFLQRGSDPDIWMNATADRAMRTDGARLHARDHGLPIVASIVRRDRRRVGSFTVPHLHSGQRVDLCEPVDLSAQSWTDRLPAHFAGVEAVYVGLDGQSNQHDAALGAFAARDFLMNFWPQQVRDLMTAQHRAALAAGQLEDDLASSITGRTLGAPYLTPIEQVTIYVLARVFASDAPIIEIGTALGGSAVLMATATKGDNEGEPIIVSVDPDSRARSAVEIVFRQKRLSERLRMVCKTSDDAVHEVSQTLQRVGNGAGLIFIDGMHTFEQSRRDFENYATLVRPGGVLLFHDFDARFAGVARTVSEVAATDERFTPLCIMDTIAVFQRRL